MLSCTAWKIQISVCIHQFLSLNIIFQQSNIWQYFTNINNFYKKYENHFVIFFFNLTGENPEL